MTIIVNRLRNLTRPGLDLTECPRPFSFSLMLKFFYSPEKKTKVLASPWHSWKSVDGSLDRCYVAMADSALKSDDRTDQRARISDQRARTESIVRGNHGGCTQVRRSKLRAFMCRPMIVLVPCLSTVLATSGDGEHMPELSPGAN